MPKTNAAGVPSYYDARGTDETAVSADGQTHLLDPTATVDESGAVVDTPGLEVAEDERFATREEIAQREERAQAEGGASSPEDGTDSSESSKLPEKTTRSSSKTPK